ncbi:type II toxin-antitoxin system Phd/YefM family antitoxin [Candidatus Gottesmanbacteria bacterium]|nr:type II toxin-antitoxin system Phd/YefM family antitoxin [Candidatus Gottesmanbacteria bacterium]
MNKTQVSIDELRTNLAEIIGRVMYGNSQVVVKKYNREAAVIISKEEYEMLKDPTKRLTRKEWEKMFKTIDKIRDRIPVKDQKKLEAEIDRAVREVRAEKKQYAQKT